MHRRNILACAIALALTAATGAQTRITVPIEYHTLDNGLKVVLSRDTSSPTAVVAIYYNIGFRIEPKDRTGFAHLFEHMMFQGSQHLGKNAFIRLVESNGGILNGSTRFDFTNYFQIIPSHTVETVLWAEADRMRGLDITQENLTNQQEVVKNEVKVNVLNAPYGGFPWLDLPQIANTNWYNAHNFYGDLAHLDAATLDDVKQFFETYYSPNNAVLVVTGDIDTTQTLGMVKKYFAGIPAAKLPPQPDISEPRQEKEKRANKEDALASRPALAVGYHVPPRNTPEWYAMGLIDDIMVQGQDSRLREALVQKRGMTDNVTGGINILLGSMFDVKGPTLWTAFLIHDAERKPDEILAVIDEEVARLQKTPLTKDEMSRAQVKRRSRLYAEQEQFVRFGRANLLASFALFDEDPGRINRLEEAFASVTPALIQKTANEYLRTGNRTVLTVTPKPASANGVDAAARQDPFPSTPPKPGPARDFRVPEPKRLTLDNGLEIVMVQWGEFPKVLVTLDIRSGNAFEDADEVWLSDLTGNLLREGTATRSASQISEEAARMGGSLNVSVGSDRTTIGGDVLSEFAPEMIALVADVVQNPKFPGSELPRLKADLMRQLAVAKSQPQQLAVEKFRAVLYGDHPTGRVFPTEAMIKGYSADQVGTFYKSTYGAGRARLYIVGRFNGAAAEAAARKAFAGWGRGTPPRVTPPKPTTARVVHLIDRPGAVQSSVLIGMPVIDPTHEDYVALTVMDALLGGAFASRITKNIREDKGYTYSPSSDVSTRYRDAYWVENADVTTNVTGPAIKEILAEIDRLQAEPPAADELVGIQNYLAGTFVLQNSSRGGITGQLAYMDLHGLPASYANEYVKKVHAVTPAKVTEMARKYLKDDVATIVVVGDRKAVEEQLKPFGRVETAK